MGIDDVLLANNTAKLRITNLFKILTKHFHVFSQTFSNNETHQVMLVMETFRQRYLSAAVTNYAVSCDLLAAVRQWFCDILGALPH